MESERLAACQTRLATDSTLGADAVVLSPGENLTYLTGSTVEPSERALFLVLTADNGPTWFGPELAAQQLTEGTPVTAIRTWADSEGPTEPLRELLSVLSLAESHILVDETMWARFTQLLRSVAPESTFGLATEFMTAHRIRKDESELAALRRAATATDTALQWLRALGEDAIGLTENELATKIETELSAAGGESLSFEPIVGSGPNGAMPHHTHGDRVIQRDDPVVLDFGCRIDGYPADQTRTVVFGGEPSAQFRAVHEVVKAAQQAAVETVKPGVTAGEVDAAARTVIASAGYGEQFIHRTGHGVGLAVHEEPKIVEGSQRVLEPNMVFSIEPGVYLPDQFGVRIEDLVVVTDTGCERLNRTPRGWQLPNQ